MSDRENISALLADTRHVSRVKNLQFGVLSPEEIRRGSVVEVTLADTYDGTQPKDHGLFDPRMGVIDAKRICLTDHYDRQICPGYFGHIELAMPVFWEQFMDVVVKILRCVCIQCGHVLLDKTNPQLIADVKRRVGTGRFTYLYNHITSQKPHNGALRCSFEGGCMVYQPSKIEKILPEAGSAEVNPLTIRATYEKNLFPNQDISKQFNLPPDYVYRLFRRLTDEDIDLFGFSPKFSRPEWFICTVLPVCPPSVRPSVRQDDNQRREDDLTCKLADIIKTNDGLRKLKEKNADMKKIAEHHGLLQYHIAIYVNNEITRIPQGTRRSGSPLKTFRQRLSGKEGRIRTNLMGKRVNFSARTVITIDANLAIDQWGVPRKIAMNLTIPEIVTEWNREEMLELVRRGPNVHPGAKSVTKMNYDENGVPHPEEWSLRCGDRTRINLEPGDIVMRHVRDGDVCMFNRQPSVHRMSMMGHRVKVIDGSTFRFNVSVCKPYNADFDGDEMNMHVPQSLQTRYELEWITLVPTQIFTPQGGQGIISLVFDSLTGMYRFSRQNKPLTGDMVQNLLMVSPIWNGKMIEADMDSQWSPSAMYSMLLPMFSYKGKNGLYNDNPVEENEVVIEKGRVRMGGVFDKSVLGPSQNAIMKTLGFWYGNWAAKNYIDNTQQMVNDWLSTSGLSVGIGDVIAPLPVLERITQEVQKGIQDVNQILEQAHHGLFEPNLQSEYFFKSLENAIQKCTAMTGDKIANLLMKYLDPNNRFLEMVACGAKGNKGNLQQTTGIVGQQTIDGKRTQFHFTARTLPHFTKDDFSAQSRGFIVHSFTEGLAPTEYFFHQMASREGTIDTAIKSVSGDTTIIIIENEKSKYVKIGDWIDGLLTDNSKDIEYLPEKEQELLQLKDKVYIPTTNEKGVVEWGEVSAVTRHDPGKEMFEIKTKSGRSVKVVESKSLIVWNEDLQAFKEMPTTEVKIGDCLPVTFQLNRPPVYLQNVSITNLFSKTEYIYGTDFNKARKMYEEMMDGRKKSISGWWSDHNGKSFTLPYSRIALFSRSLVRSNTKFENGYIYPLRGNHSNGIPELFNLNFENGTFIGLFLAEGNTDFRGGTIKISNNNQCVIDFVQKWFETHGIHNKIESKINNIGGVSISIVGFSRLLVKLFDNIVGKLSYNKSLPDFTFTSNDDFIKGILSGYFSGDGGITSKSIYASTASKKLAEGIIFLCSRLNIFAKTSISHLKNNNLLTKNIAPAYRIDIRGQWASIFSKVIDLLDSSKKEKIKSINPSLKHRNYTVFNDVVLDSIVEINRLNVEDYPKVYDITVPSTFNFGLANGLQVRDTADVGYIQRRLIKAMEDINIQYDLTVRSAAKSIIQFRYGDDGYDAMTIQKQKLELFEKSFTEMQNDYDISVQEWSSWEKLLVGDMKKQWKSQGMKEKERAKTAFDELVETQKEMRQIDFKYAKDADFGSTLFCPVHFPRLIQKVKDLYATGGAPEVMPSKVIDAINELITELTGYMPDYTLNRFKAQLKSMICVKRVVVKERWSQEAFAGSIREIREYFMKGICQPGEMIGTLTAEMLGEPLTQLTLNSVEWNTEIILEIDGLIQKVKIGEWIDCILPNCSHIEEHPNDTKLGWIDKHKIRVPACTEEGKIIWDNVQAITKHPVINADGSNTLIKVITRSGREVIATKAKSFLKRINNKIIGIDGADLKVGDYIPFSKVLNIEETDNIWDISNYFDKNKWIHIEEVEKARKVYFDYKATNKKNWFLNNGTLFTVPYKRADVLASAFGFTGKDIRRNKVSKPGCIYPFYLTKQSAHIPSKIIMDELFGFFVGAYLAEGCTSCNYQVLISNINTEFNDKIFMFCEKYELKYHIEKRTINNGLSQTIRIHSNVLSQLFNKAIGTGSNVKRIPDNFYNAPKDFLRGLIDGYFSGDGSISKSHNEIHACSISKYLLEDIQRILIMFNIQTIIKEIKTVQKNAEKNGINAQKAYNLTVIVPSIDKFRKEFKLTIEYKQERLNNLSPTIDIGRFDIIPDVQLSSGVQTVYRNKLDKLIMNTKNEDDIHILESIKKENVYYDEIISIEEIESLYPYVYDLTVEKTKNFNIANGLCMRDTFHSAGRADAGAVTTTGVPRMKEIVNLAGKQKQKQIKTPSMTIYLRDPWRSDLNKAKDLKSILEFTKLGDLVTQTKILFDPVQSVFESGSQRAPGVDFEEEDEFTRLYYSFSEAVGAPTADPSNTSPWVLRMEFDRDKMVSHNITMADIRRVLTSNEELNQDISITFSDDNAGDLVMRVRVNSIQEDTDPVAFLQMMAHKNLMNVTIQGIQGISLAVPKKVNTLYYNADGKPDMRSDWIIQTDGVNIFEVLMMDFVDAERMMCNDINMVKEIFGIEAARAILVHEFGVLLSESVSDLNYRHISVVCDVMAYRGDLMSIDRHGLKRSPDISAFAKASNEESVEILVNAGVFADTDRMTGVSSNILMGQQPNGGTNAFEILLDESNLVDKVEVSAPDYRPSTIYEEVGEATTWGAEDDVVEEVVESAHPEYQGFMANDPFEIQFEGDRLDRLGRLDVETTIPRPPLFKSTQKWVNVDES